MYDAIKEAQKLCAMEEAQRATKPQNIGSLFIKVISHDGPMTINIHQIQSYIPSVAGTFIFLVGEEDPILAYHNYDEINNLFSLSIFR